MPQAAAAPITAPVGRLISSDSLPVGGFTPGMVLAGRYRIIGLIGRGGMGEVYRADDLKLGQPVALKFLPKSIADDPVRRERLFAEVRIARQVSHPNICRVYDISELEGRHFLTMEYIDGEDLASLLKRIGSLHGAKALDVARQLCAGVAAAHDKGVLHRDLKPANVMIDGRGHVRITDFGLAITEGGAATETEVSGTPAYMAPEQFAGKGASVRSDIYALGLVMYELFTGSRAFDAKTLAELRAQKEISSPTAPSEIARDIDPIVEKIILRCMEKDPRQRPSSAARVAAALPGGDPLAAALAAGETPSPEMVAASGSIDGLKPWIAWTCLVVILLFVGAAVLLGREANLIHRVPLENHPQAMAFKARDILKNLGYEEMHGDSAYGFEANEAYFDYVETNDRSPARFARVPALALQFWYRQSPYPLEHLGVDPFATARGGVNANTPPVMNSGESIVCLDSRGNLVGLRVIPGKAVKSDAAQQPDWSMLFKAAGFSPSRFTQVEPDWTYLAYADSRAAWTGTLPDYPDLPIRIDAAAWKGTPVFWRLNASSGEGPAKFEVSSVDLRPAHPDTRFRLIVPCLLAFALAGLLFARRNLRMGRGDRRGATRVACFLFLAMGICWIIGEHHIVSSGEVNQFCLAAAIWLWMSATIWVLYIAIEPFLRRHLPGWLVGWSRLLAGKFRDPLIGRDLLAGCTFGVLLAMINYVRFPLAVLSGAPQVRPSKVLMGIIEGAGTGWTPKLNILAGAHAVISTVLGTMLGCVVVGLIASFIFFLLRILFKRTWAAAIGFVLLVMIGNAPGSIVSAVLVATTVVGIVFLLLRFGVLAYIAGIFFYNLLIIFPITTHLSDWYSGIGFTGLAVLLAFVLYAFYISLGGQPFFGRASLED